MMWMEAIKGFDVVHVTKDVCTFNRNGCVHNYSSLEEALVPGAFGFTAHDTTCKMISAWQAPCELHTVIHSSLCVPYEYSVS